MNKTATRIIADGYTVVISSMKEALDICPLEIRDKEYTRENFVTYRLYVEEDPIKSCG